MNCFLYIFRSIGCILYEMCSLDHAFDGKSLMAVMYKIVEGEPFEHLLTFIDELGSEAVKKRRGEAVNIREKSV